jgi:hypothetical protein
MNKLQKYKIFRINVLTKNYNNSVDVLKNKLSKSIQYINLLKIVSSSKKASYIINCIFNYNKSVKILKTKLYNNIKRIKLLSVLPAGTGVLTIRSPNSALLIGINYTNTVNELQGCINDTVNIKQLLKQKYHYNNNNVTVLTDYTNTKPTKRNILTEFTKLMTNAISGDTIVFFYSGHGTKSLDLHGDETDSQTEYIVPIDATTIETCIIDDEITAIIHLNLKPGVTLFTIFDSCFSGTILDLKYQYYDTLHGGNNVINNLVLDTQGQVYLFSGCNDAQTSADVTTRVGKKNYYGGAMTNAFIKVITNNSSNVSLTHILKKMRTILVNNNFTQIPQLSSGQSIDPTTTTFSL